MFLLSKLLPLPIFPLGFAILMCILGIALIHFKKYNYAKISLVLAVFVLWIPSTRICSDLIMGFLERDIEPLIAENAPTVDAIVLLGGTSRGSASKSGNTNFDHAVDRILFAAQLYQQGKAPLVITTGGSPEGETPEAILIGQLLQTLGVPEHAQILETKSRNTTENALFTFEILQEKKLNKILLVTSANHMPRALKIFNRLNIEIIAAPIDYQVVEKQPNILHWLPMADNLEVSTRGIKEFYGLLKEEIR